MLDEPVPGILQLDLIAVEMQVVLMKLYYGQKYPFNSSPVRIIESWCLTWREA